VPNILGKEDNELQLFQDIPGYSLAFRSSTTGSFLCWAVLGKIMKKIEKAIQKWRRVGTQEDIWPLKSLSCCTVFEVIPPSSLTLLVQTLYRNMSFVMSILLVAGNAEKSAKNHRQ
jgi:hypothetical protein